MLLPTSGHATLAAAFVLFNHENHPDNMINFYSPRSGNLTVTKKGNLLTLNFPTDVFEPVELFSDLINGFNLTPVEAYKGRSDFMLE